MREQKINVIVMGIILAIAGVMGVIEQNFLIAAIFIAASLGAIYIVEDKNKYNMLYAVLLVSAIIDYTLYVPGIESIYMFHIMLGIFTLVSLYKVYKDRDILRRIDKKVLAIYAVWFLYSIISIFWAMNKSLSIKYIAIYLMMFSFIFCMITYNINKNRMKQTIKLLLYLVSIVVVIGTIEVILGKQLPVKHYIDGFLDTLPKWQINTINARPIVFSYNTNNLNALLALLVPICMFTIYEVKNLLLKVWFAVVTIISFGLIVITTSRTGYVSFILGFAVFVLYSVINVKRIGLKQLIYPAVIIVGLFLAYNYAPSFMNIKPVEGQTVQHTTSLSGKLQSLIDMSSSKNEGDDEEGKEHSTLNRMSIIKDVVGGVFTEKHYLGFGVGNVEEYIKEQGNSGGVYSPHCYPIEILGDFGVVGVLIFGIYYLYLLIGNTIIAIKRKSLSSAFAVAGLIAFMPASFGPSSITYVFSYWILMGIAVSSMQIKESI